jgi:hypothetical protein
MVMERFNFHNTLIFLNFTSVMIHCKNETESIKYYIKVM